MKTASIRPSDLGCFYLPDSLIERAKSALGFIGIFLILFTKCGASQEQYFNFNDDEFPPGWRVASGDWKIKNGALFVDSTQGLSTVFFGDKQQENYEITAKLTFLEVENSSRWVSIVFRASQDGATPWFQVPIRFHTTAKNGIEFAVQTKNGWDVRETGKASQDSTLKVARKLRVVVRGTRVEAYLDAKHLISSAYCLERERGCLGFAASGCKVLIDDVIIKPLPATEIRLSQLPRKKCAVIAHRGYSDIAPENTLASARAAVEVGADGTEFDVQLSKDGRVIVLHDDTLDRTTNGKGPSKNMLFKEIRKLDAGSWKDQKYAGEKVPDLGAILTLLKGTRCEPIIEIKAKGAETKIVELLQRMNMTEKVTVIGFDLNTIKTIRQLDSRIPCYWLLGKQPGGTVAEQAEWIHREAQKIPTMRVNLNYRMLSPELIAALQKRGMKVWCWTVNSPAVMDALMRWGIDGITTDIPPKALELLQK